MKSKFLFIYGLLKKGFRSNAKKELNKNSSFVGNATLNGKLFLVEDYPGAVESKANNKKNIIHGELYRIKNQQHLFTVLDEFEECSRRFPEPTLFKKKICKVNTEEGNEIKAWVYIYNRKTKGLKQIKSGIFTK
jgi:gamma-glutamylcyclotransferase (GGCT)/AIG2-like uncharacterized protein YtfP